MNTAFWDRMRIFFKERFPIFLGAVTTLIGTLSLYLVWVAVTDGAALIFNTALFVAFISFFLLTVILRLSDEIKDREVDAELFPERCLPSGKVLYSDIEKFLTLVAVIWIPLNFIFGGSPLLFTLLMIYAYLFYKYFFMPEQISKNLLLALFTHNPIMFLASFYIISIFSIEQGISPWSIKNVLLALAFWMPSIAWETSRKIRAPRDENNYVTYSKILGPVGASLLPIGAAFIQMMAMIIVVKTLHYNMQYLLGNATMFVLYFMVFFIFMLKKSTALSLKLRQTTEAYILCTSLLIVVIAVAEIIK
jgi:hypothetical protein